MATVFHRSKSLDTKVLFIIPKVELAFVAAKLFWLVDFRLVLSWIPKSRSRLDVGKVIRV